MDVYDEKRKVLDVAIADAAAPHLTDGELLTSWLVVVGTRHSEGGGVVIVLAHDDAIPQYEVRGLLTTAVATIDRVEDADQGGGL